MKLGFSVSKGFGVLRVLGIIIGSLVIVGVGLALFFYAMMRHFHPAPPTLLFSAARNPLESQRQDLNYFSQLVALDRSFPTEARQEVKKRLDQLESQSAVLDPAHLRAALMAIDALADNGHSNVESDAAPLELPIRVGAFADGIFVMRATEPNADLLGGRVIAIDGHPINAVLTKLELLRGGAPQWRRAYASQFMVLQDLLYGTDIALDVQKSTFTVVTPDGATVSRALSAYTSPKNEPRVFVKRWISSEPLNGLGTDWRAYEPRAPLPLAIKDFDTPFRSFPLPGTCTWFVQFKSNADVDKEHIKDFVTRVKSEMRQSHPCNVILDLRFDDGGDYMNTYGFARNLPGLVAPSGRIYVLTGPWTFSAGISTVAFVKNAAPDRVVILGERVGDRAAFFSEGGRACLPHQRLCVSYETGKHDYEHACTDWDVCFWLNFFVKLRVSSLEPDELIPTRFEDWQAGIDPVLVRAIVLAKDNEPARIQSTSK